MVIRQNLKQEKSLSFGSKAYSENTTGAIMVFHSRELVNQAYKLIKQIDYKDKLRVNRAASSLQTKAPIVEYITQNAEDEEKYT